MGEFRDPDIDDPLYIKIADALEIATSDLSPEGWWEEEGLKQLRSFSVCPGSEKVLEKWLDLDGGDAYAYYWFVRAGFKEAIPLLEACLDSDDRDDVIDAINGLLYVNHPRSYEEIQRFFEGTHRFQICEPLALLEEFETDLKNVNTELSRTWLAKLKDG